MAIIKLIELISCSSQDKGYGPENLMNYRRKRPWLSSFTDVPKQIEAEFQLCKASQIDFIDIGNNGSSTFEIQVGRSSNPLNYVTLLPAVSLLTLADLKEGADKKSVYMYNSCNMVQSIAEQKWDRLKIICRQPYSKKIPFGLKFMILRTKNDWEIHSNEENKDLCVKENKSRYSLPLRDQCSSQSEVSAKVISRGEQLVEASKAQHSSTTKIREMEDCFKEDVRVFFIAFCDDVVNGLSSEGCMSEFEMQKQRKLSPKEQLLFQDVYSEFNPFPSVVHFADLSSFNPTVENDENTAEKDSVIDLGFYGNETIIPSYTFNSLIDDLVDQFENSSCELNDNPSKKSPNTSEELMNIEGSSLQPQDEFSFTFKTVSKSPVRTNVPSSKQVKNSFDLVSKQSDNKAVKLHPKFRHKNSTHGKRVFKPTVVRVVPASVKREHEDSTGAGSIGKKHAKVDDPFPTKTIIGYNRPEDFIQFDGVMPSTSKGFTFVDCPICQESFHPDAIEKHAATCGEFEDPDCQILTDSCPFCAAKFPSQEVDLHIENCFRYH